MTTIDHPRPRSRRRHPVTAFVALLLVLAMVLGALAWTRVLDPSVTSPATSAWGTTPDRSQAYGTVEITNRGSLPVRIKSLAWATTGLADPEVRVQRAHTTGPHDDTRYDFDAVASAAPAFAPFTLAGGASRVIFVVGRPTCTGADQGPWRMGRPVIGVRSRLGIDRVRAVSRATEGVADCPVVSSGR